MSDISLDTNIAERNRPHYQDASTMPEQSVPPPAQNPAQNFQAAGKPTISPGKHSRPVSTIAQCLNIGLGFRTYDQKYPKDEPGQEMGDNARFWKIYRDEANEIDNDNIGEWHKTIDWLLIFVRRISCINYTLTHRNSFRLVSSPLPLPHF
jgi:hypothetical protein